MKITINSLCFHTKVAVVHVLLDPGHQGLEPDVHGGVVHSATCLRPPLVRPCGDASAVGSNSGPAPCLALQSLCRPLTPGSRADDIAQSMTRGSGEVA